jgi:hypothetical protein
MELGIHICFNPFYQAAHILLWVTIGSVSHGTLVYFQTTISGVPLVQEADI